MLEKRMVPEEAAFGQGYVFCAAAGLKSGSIVKNNGVWTALQVTGVLGNTYSNKPGYARAGDLQWVIMLHTDTAVATPQTWIIKKYEYSIDGSDLSLDAAVSGEGVVAYNEGWFETDAYATDITSAMAVGTHLYVSGGLLCSGRAPAQDCPKRARYWGIKSSYDTGYYAQAPIYVQILPMAVSSGWV